MPSAPGPISVKELTTGAVDPLVRVGAEVVALSLD